MLHGLCTHRCVHTRVIVHVIMLLLMYMNSCLTLYNVFEMSSLDLTFICWGNPFGFGSIRKHSLVKSGVLHLDVPILWVVFSSDKRVFLTTVGDIAVRNPYSLTLSYIVILLYHTTKYVVIYITYRQYM